MFATIPLLALFGVYVLHLGWGPSLLLAAMLAPTDPVLAHDVQVHNPGDHDLLRFALSGEGGLNDGIALAYGPSMTSLPSYGSSLSRRYARERRRQHPTSFALPTSVEHFPVCRS